MEKNGSHNAHGRLCSPYVNVVLVVSLAIAAFYLIVEHRAHLYGYLSWLLPVAFIALHFWMHAGHRHGSHRSHVDQKRDPPPAPDRRPGAHQH
jgi:hypothetical protein